MKGKISLSALSGHTPWRFTTVADGRAGGTALSCLQINDYLCDIVHPGLYMNIIQRNGCSRKGMQVYLSLSLSLSDSLSLFPSIAITPSFPSYFFFYSLQLYIGRIGKNNRLNFTTKILRLVSDHLVWLPFFIIFKMNVVYIYNKDCKITCLFTLNSPGMITGMYKWQVTSVWPEYHTCICTCTLCMCIRWTPYLLSNWMLAVWASY